jgi:hypothetical protein
MKNIFLYLTLTSTCWAQGPGTTELCGKLHDLVHFKREIKKQKDIEKMTGVFDKEVMYQAGQAIMNLSPEIDQLENEFQKTNGQRLGFGECPDNFKSGL